MRECYDLNLKNMSILMALKSMKSLDIIDLTFHLTLIHYYRIRDYSVITTIAEKKKIEFTQHVKYRNHTA